MPGLRNDCNSVGPTEPEWALERKQSMTPRENLRSLYERNGYEWVPADFGACPEVQEKIKQAIGEETLAEYFDWPQGLESFVGTPGVKLVEREEPDWRSYYPGGVADGAWFEPYGVVHEPGSAAAKHMTRMRHPLSSIDSVEQLEAFPWPDWEWDNIDEMAAAVETAHAGGKAVMKGMQQTIWETAWKIRDMTQLMMDMMTNDPKAVWLLDKITDDSCRRAASYARAGADIVSLGDDIGMQDRIMMSEEMYREWLKPRLATVCATIKEANPDTLIHYHSCGYVTPFIQDLIEAGVDILNPVQPECMSFEEIHAEYGDRLSFHGTIGTQTTMPFGTPQDVRDTVFRNLDIAREQGGLLPAPTHILEPEVTWENVKAYILACKEYA